MTTNQEARQQALRDGTGASETVAGDWHAFWDDQGIADGTFNERMLAWINTSLGSSYTNINGAMYAYAADQGFDRWTDIGTGVEFGLIIRPGSASILYTGGAAPGVAGDLTITLGAGGAVIYTGGTAPTVTATGAPPSPGPTGDGYLTESGDYYLLETGDFMLIE